MDTDDKMKKMIKVTFHTEVGVLNMAAISSVSFLVNVWLNREWIDLWPVRFLHRPAHWPLFSVAYCVQVQPKESVAGLWNCALQARGEPTVLHAVLQNWFQRVERGRRKYLQLVSESELVTHNNEQTPGTFVYVCLHHFSLSWTLTWTEECSPWWSRLWSMKGTVCH